MARVEVHKVEKLSDANYEVWRRNMQMSRTVNGMWSAVDGAIAAAVAGGSANAEPLIKDAQELAFLGLHVVYDLQYLVLTKQQHGRHGKL